MRQLNHCIETAEQADDGGKQKDKNPGDFYLNPFKVDGIVKIGWGVINLYGTYSFSTLFRSGKGPEFVVRNQGTDLMSISSFTHEL